MSFFSRTRRALFGPQSLIDTAPAPSPAKEAFDDGLEDAALWDQAIEDIVVAIMNADAERKPPIGAIADHVRTSTRLSVPDARVLFEETRAFCAHMKCRCRHHALMLAGARAVEQESGGRFRVQHTMLIRLTPHEES